jgi:branched-chain amino acid transport system ATP-binding protein
MSFPFFASGRRNWRAPCRGVNSKCSPSRALMSRPSILLLDEPSLGLAPKIVEEIFAIIGQIKADGTAVLLVEQNAALALDVAEYGFVLDLGQIALEGSAEVLKDSPIVRASYL